MPNEVTPADVAVSIVEMQALLLGTETIEEFIAELAALAILTVGEGLSCGITLQANGPLTVASTDTLASQVDEVQYGLDQGPCLHAMRTGIPVSIEDLTSDKRWTAYAATALRHGIRSSLSLPLSVGGNNAIGAFNLYSLVVGSFDKAATHRAERFAYNASGALAMAVRLADHVALTDQLRASLASRSVIDQAIGVLMTQRRITAVAAFAILRTTSQNRNIKLRAFAAQIVEGVGAQPPQLPPFNPPRPRSVS
jgi:GAF domain-containing protein